MSAAAAAAAECTQKMTDHSNAHEQSLYKVQSCLGSSVLRGVSLKKDFLLDGEISLSFFLMIDLLCLYAAWTFLVEAVSGHVRIHYSSNWGDRADNLEQKRRIELGVEEANLSSRTHYWELSAPIQNF